MVNKRNITILSILFILSIFYLIISPKYQSREVNSDLRCVLIKENNNIILGCKKQNENNWERYFFHDGSNWKKGDRENIYKYAYLNSDQINKNNLGNFKLLTEKYGLMIHEPLKEVLKENSRIGVYSSKLKQANKDYILLRIRIGFKEYIFEYMLNENNEFSSFDNAKFFYVIY